MMPLPWYLAPIYRGALDGALLALGVVCLVRHAGLMP